MIAEIPQFCLRAYALFFIKHRSRDSFQQSELDWITSQSMKKKIFSILLHAGWIKKSTRDSYICVAPEKVMRGLLEFKVPEVIKEAKKPYAFTGLSAVEIWSDYCYVQRSIEKSPYFIKIVKKDIPYWKAFFSKKHISSYIHAGATIGEYVIFIPVEKIIATEKEGVMVDPLQETMRIAKENEMYAYAYIYMKEKY